MNQDVFGSLPPELLKGTTIVVSLLVGVVYFLYLKNLSGLVKVIQPANRRLRPSLVWLLAIDFLDALIFLPVFIDEKALAPYETPLYVFQLLLLIFKLILTFYLVHKIAESLDAELKSRRMEGPEKPTLAIGMVMCICNTATLLSGIEFLAVFGFLGSIAGFGAWIVYWTKTNEYRVLLKNEPPPANLKDLGID